MAARLGGLESCDPTGDQVLCWEGIFCNGPKESTFNWLKSLRVALLHFGFDQEEEKLIAFYVLVELIEPKGGRCKIKETKTN